MPERLIDAGRIEKRLLEEEPHDGWDEYYEGFNRMKGIALNAIDATPTIDAVPVVRCGDCRHGKVSDECFGLDGTPLIQCQYCTLPNQPFEYCSWGEKMDGEKGEKP